VVITAIIRDVTERKHVEQQLKHLADHDPLTGLANRRCFEARVEEALRQAARHGHRVAVLLLDIDDFKYDNDTRGHSFGDELIRSIAACLRDAVRETDLLARLGGDEFAVLITHAGEMEAVDAAGRLLTALRERGPRPTGRRVYVTASIGVAASDAQDTVADDLLVKADIAMYAAKDAGRNRWASFDPAWAEADNVRARGTWVERLRQALDGDGFTLFAQPMRSLTGDPLAHHELLVRMRDGAGRLAAPATFIGTAERFGLIQSLDRWVLRHAIEVAAQTTGAGAPRLSVNLSAKSLADAELPGMIGDVLAEHQVDPGRLILEITETAAIASMDDAIDFARTVRELGCHLALDDFGAGFGSFSYVKHLPLDYLKIDGEFIHELSASHHNRLIVAAIVGIARGLGQKTVAEFVEDAHTMTLLQAAGVDYAQGFHVGRPRPVAEVFPTASPDPSRTRPLRG
jgi:diguanylate cyclase (GGDEF)-like protein